MKTLIKWITMAIFGMTALYTVSTYKLEAVHKENHTLTIEYSNKNYDDIFHIEITGVK